MGQAATLWSCKESAQALVLQTRKPGAKHKERFEAKTSSRRRSRGTDAEGNMTYIAIFPRTSSDADVKLLWSATRKPVLQGVTVPWAPDFIRQGENGLERVRTEYLMPLVGAFDLIDFDKITLHGAN